MSSLDDHFPFQMTSKRSQHGGDGSHQPVGQWEKVKFLGFFRAKGDRVMSFF